jgi:hypothetical protein
MTTVAVPAVATESGLRIRALPGDRTLSLRSS